MKNSTIKNIHNQLRKEVWAEDAQKIIQQLPTDIAKDVVESMNQDDIYIRVNHRRMQEDYIADYIDHLWEISPKAFWKHVLIVLDKEHGILWGGDMFYFSRMCSNKIPEEVLFKIIDFLATYKSDYPGDYEQDMGAVNCVIKAQVTRFERMNEIETFIQKSMYADKDLVRSQITNAVNSTCHYSFMDYEL